MASKTGNRSARVAKAKAVSKNHVEETSVHVEIPTTQTQEPWYRSIFTDHEGEFDGGAVWVAVATLGMLFLSWYDVSHNKDAHFDPQQFGIGIGAMLAGFAAYKWGDTRRPMTTITTKK